MIKHVFLNGYASDNFGLLILPKNRVESQSPFDYQLIAADENGLTTYFEAQEDGKAVTHSLEELIEFRNFLDLAIAIEQQKKAQND